MQEIQQPTQSKAIHQALFAVEHFLMEARSRRTPCVIVIHDTDNDGHMAVTLFEMLIKHLTYPSQGVAVDYYPNTRVNQERLVKTALNNAPWNRCLLVYLDVSPSYEFFYPTVNDYNGMLDVLVIDHHQSAWENLSPLLADSFMREHVTLAIPMFNPASTAELVRGICKEANMMLIDSVVRMVQYIDVRDRWQTCSPLWDEALKFVAGLRYNMSVGEVGPDGVTELSPRELFGYFVEDVAFDPDLLSEVCWMGGKLRQREAYDIGNYIRRGNIKIMPIADNLIVAVYVSHLSPSDLGNAILEKMPDVTFTMQVSLNQDGGIKVELRSRNGGYNVSELACSLGGGGHVAAAGFNLGYSDPVSKNLSAVLGGSCFSDEFVEIVKARVPVK